MKSNYSENRNKFNGFYRFITGYEKRREKIILKKLEKLSEEFPEFITEFR